MDGVKENASTISKVEKEKKIAETSKALAQSKDIETARKQFKALSASIITSSSPKERDHAGLKIASCPMANAKWLQKEETLRNPYYGSSMLECGAFEKTQ